MTQKKNKFTFISQEKKMQYLTAIIDYYQTERNEQIGIIAAEELLEFFLSTAGEEVYRKAIGDCKKILTERFEDIHVELDVLAPGQ